MVERMHPRLQPSAEERSRTCTGLELKGLANPVPKQSRDVKEIDHA